MSICGLDIGTTGCKISAFAKTDALFLGSVYAEYDVSRNNGHDELDAEMVFAHIKRLMKEITDKYGEIEAMGVTSLGESFVMLDENDKMLFPAMVYTDVRGGEEVEELISKIPEDKIAIRVGEKPHSMFSVPKMMWIKKHHPDLFEKAVYFPLMQDYIVYMLTGVKQIDYTLATRSMGFDVEKKCWWDELFEAAGLDASKMSKPVPTGTLAGKIKPELAKELGISENTLIVTGCQDQIAAVTGAGAIGSGDAMLGMGTVACVPIVLDSLPDNMDFYDAGYSVVPHIEEGKYVCYALSYACGSMLKWYRDNLVRLEAEIAAEKGENIYKTLDERAPEEPTGLFVLPYFSGAATPYMDPFAKGAIVGLSLSNTADDVYKAFMEGVAYEMKVNMAEIEKYGLKVSSVRATGGGAMSKVWLQIMSDILGIPVVQLLGSEIGAMGTALYAGIAAGCYGELKEMLDKTVAVKNIFTPDENRNAEYNELFEKYRKVYAAVKPLA